MSEPEKPEFAQEYEDQDSEPTMKAPEEGRPDATVAPRRASEGTVDDLIEEGADGAGADRKGYGQDRERSTQLLEEDVAEQLHPRS
jgi:hypothetical protein